MYKLFNSISNHLLSEKVKEDSERFILTVAIVSYIIHLLLIALVHNNIIEIDSKLFKSPISAIYTPFSFILVYEVYLLIFFLPKSITTYIGKQYEIITLIVVRRIFKDISKLEIETNWFENINNIKFTYDVITSLVLFILIYLFYKNNKPSIKILEDTENKVTKFINFKKGISTTLIPILLIIATYSLYDWIINTIYNYQNNISSFEDINNIFFGEFFSILIIVDVILLLLSFFYSDEFHKIIRNSGFVISTILIKTSFSTDGIINNYLIIGAVLFGYLILVIHNMYEKSSLK